jgi:hypothetical protein
MNVYTMVVVIVAFATIAQIAKTWLGSRAMRAGDETALRDLRTQVAALSGRVATLERIAADPKEKLAQEIDALR